MTEKDVLKWTRECHRAIHVACSEVLAPALNANGVSPQDIFGVMMTALMMELIACSRVGGIKGADLSRMISRTIDKLMERPG